MKKISRGAYEDTKGTIRVLETVAEVVLLTVLYYWVWRIGYAWENYLYNGKFVLMGVYGALLFLFFNQSECTKFGQLQRTELVIGQTISFFIVNVITYLQLCLIDNHVISVLPMLVLTAVEIVIAVVLVYVFDKVYYRLYPPHDMLLIFGRDSAVDLKFKMDARKDKYRITKVVPADYGFARIKEVLRDFDSVILNDVPPQLRNEILNFCYRYRIRAYIAPELTDIMLRGAKENTLFDTPLLTVKSTGLSPMQRVVKRTMDIILSGIALVIASPVMLVVALAIKLEDGGPVFFRQMRLTRGGREFEILKFRSMIVDAEKYAGAVFASDNDPRITKVGKFIRATRLDELPQILNILKGDMSVVGPRPERKVFADQFAQEIPGFHYRLKVRGGLTGYAQIYGKYNTSAYDKLRLDMMYIENYSLLLDIKLIILTIRIIFSKESTEGIDKAQQIQQQSQELLRRLREENE